MSSEKELHKEDPEKYSDTSSSDDEDDGAGGGGDGVLDEAFVRRMLQMRLQQGEKKENPKVKMYN